MRAGIFNRLHRCCVTNFVKTMTTICWTMTNNLLDTNVMNITSGKRVPSKYNCMGFRCYEVLETVPATLSMSLRWPSNVPRCSGKDPLYVLRCRLWLQKVLLVLETIGSHLTESLVLILNCNEIFWVGLIVIVYDKNWRIIYVIHQGIKQNLWLLGVYWGRFLYVGAA